jgi:hypothetical protein
MELVLISGAMVRTEASRSWDSTQDAQVCCFASVDIDAIPRMAMLTMCPVTIYVNDTTVDICAGYQEEIQPIDCYNSTFVYYSIDFCDAGAIGESPSATPTPTPTPTPPPSSSSGLSTGAIAGIAVGGGLALALITGLAVFYIMRRRNAARSQQTPGYTEPASVTPYEVHAKHIQELGPGAVAYKHTAVEIEQPPVELASTEMGRNERKGPD